MTGLIVFIAVLLVSGGAFIVLVREIEQREGGKAARGPALWLTASLAAYTGVCLGLGFGAGAQGAAAGAAVIVSVPAIPSLWRNR